MTLAKLDPCRDRRRRSEAQAKGESLLRRCADGDHEALSELHDLHHRSLMRLARGIVRTTEAAEEVVQEVFLYVWRRADRYDCRRAAVSTWLRRIARSRAIDHLRKSGTQSRAREGLEHEGARNVEPEVERQLEAFEEGQRVRRALRVLPSSQLETVLLAYYGELTQSQIAARRRIPLGTVKTRTHLAMRKLRAELAAADSSA